MAEVPINRLMPSGYDEDFVVQPDEDLHCIICHLPLKEPVLTRCGHRFCRECLEEFFRRQDRILTCPADREVLERNKGIFPDKSTERKILSLLIKCPSECCKWIGELRAKKDHLASCNFKAVSCTNENCKEKVPRKYLTEHVTITCQWRIAKCVYCREHHQQCQMENHLETCKGFQVACPNKCGTGIAREMISSHVKNCCPFTVVPCPYFGCNSKTRRQELESHLQRQHHTKLEERVKALENHPQERVNVLKNQQEERKSFTLFSYFAVGFVIVSLLFGIVIESHFDKFEEKLSGIESQLKKKVALDKFEEKLSEIKSQLKEKVALDTFEEKVSDMESQLEKKGADFQKKTDSLNTGYQIAEPYTFTWKIIGFKNVLMHAKNGRQTKIESEPFYMYGYKLKLQLWPNGCANGYKTHLSLILIIMKGECDAILDWPFRKKLKFTLIDQQENSAERKNVIFEYTPDSKDGVFAKPTKIEIFALKYYTFTSHERLRTRRFVVDDVILIQIQVGPFL